MIMTRTGTRTRTRIMIKGQGNNPRFRHFRQFIVRRRLGGGDREKWLKIQ